MKTTRFYIDKDGGYLGGFEGATPPPGAVEIPEPPDNGADVWTGSAWDTTKRASAVDPMRAAMLAILTRLKNTDATNATQYTSLLAAVQNERA